MKAEIVEKRELAADMKLMRFMAPLIARKARAGQFVVLRIDEKGERIPLTFADFDPDKGTVTIIFQEVGKSTAHLGTLEVGDNVVDLVGPLGNPSEIEKVGTVVCIGGGTGIACVHPIARALRDAGNKVISIIGARTKDLLFWESEMSAASTELHVCTDDGSYGRKGFVTEELQDIINGDHKVDQVFAIGPVVMMRAVANVTKPHNIKTIVSLNSIMIDGTGMCGGCRVAVGDKTRFVCVDGPEFDAHDVDFDELMHRQAIYLDEEKESMEKYKHQCSLDKK